MLGIGEFYLISVAVSVLYAFLVADGTPSYRRMADAFLLIHTINIIALLLNNETTAVYVQRITPAVVLLVALLEKIRSSFGQKAKQNQTGEDDETKKQVKRSGRSSEAKGTDDKGADDRRIFDAKGVEAKGSDDNGSGATGGGVVCLW